MDFKKPKLSAPKSKCVTTELAKRLVANAEVWERIFAFLGTKERIRLEVVNKRLRSLALNCWRRETSFDVSGVTSMSKKLQKRSAAVVAICSNRIGNRLRRLTLREQVPLDWTADLSSICSECPNIETIIFHIFFRWTAPCGLRFDAFTKLKSLSAIMSHEYGFIELSPATLLSIPPSIESIVGFAGAQDDQAFEAAEQLEAFFISHPLLEELGLTPLRTSDRREANIFPIIAEHCPRLKKLNFGFAFCDVDMRAIGALTSMKELYLQFGFLATADIHTICEQSPQLEALALTSNFDGPMALKAIAKLTKLRDLRLFGIIDEVDSEEMTNIVRELVRNSGASLRRLELKARLSARALELVGNACQKIRHLRFGIDPDEVGPAALRGLIQRIAADPSWNPPTEGVLRIDVDVAGEGSASADFKALVIKPEHMPAGVEVNFS